jgi:DNA invertase Pin-like site-specific DNA recombinase
VEEGSYMYGKHLSKETRRKISEAARGRILSEETRRKISEAMRGEKHPMFGKHHSEETRHKLSQATRKKLNIEDIISSYLAGDTAPRIAVRSRVSPLTIYRRLKEAGVWRPKPGKDPRTANVRPAKK